MSTAVKYPHPWVMDDVGPGEFAIVDANGVQLFNISIDYDCAEQENGGGILSQEWMAALDGDGLMPLFDQLERLFKKGPKG